MDEIFTKCKIKDIEDKNKIIPKKENEKKFYTKENEKIFNNFYKKLKGFYKLLEFLEYKHFKYVNISMSTFLFYYAYDLPAALNNSILLNGEPLSTQQLTLIYSVYALPNIVAPILFYYTKFLNNNIKNINETEPNNSNQITNNSDTKSSNTNKNELQLVKYQPKDNITIEKPNDQYNNKSIYFVLLILIGNLIFFTGVFINKNFIKRSLALLNILQNNFNKENSTLNHYEYNHMNFLILLIGRFILGMGLETFVVMQTHFIATNFHKNVVCLNFYSSFSRLGTVLCFHLGNGYIERKWGYKISLGVGLAAVSFGAFINIIDSIYIYFKFRKYNPSKSLEKNYTIKNIPNFVTKIEDKSKLKVSKKSDNNFLTNLKINFNSENKSWAIKSKRFLFKPYIDKSLDYQIKNKKVDNNNTQIKNEDQYLKSMNTASDNLSSSFPKFFYLIILFCFFVSSIWAPFYNIATLMFQKKFNTTSEEASDLVAITELTSLIMYFILGIISQKTQAYIEFILIGSVLLLLSHGALLLSAEDNSYTKSLSSHLLGNDGLLRNSFSFITKSASYIKNKNSDLQNIEIKSTPRTHTLELLCFLLGFSGPMVSFYYVCGIFVLNKKNMGKGLAILSCFNNLSFTISPLIVNVLIKYNGYISVERFLILMSFLSVITVILMILMNRRYNLKLGKYV